MKKAILLAAVVAMVAAMVLPAFATGPSSGLVNGNAVIGKVAGTCNNDGGTNPSGAGLGLPLVNGLKTVHYRLSGTVVDASHGAGTIAICGVISSVSVQGNQIGGACGLSSGHSGKGKIDYVSGPDVYLTDVGWPLSVISLLPVTGKADTTPKGTKATFSALFTTQGGVACATKAGSGASKTGGATSLTVSGPYEIS